MLARIYDLKTVLRLTFVLFSALPISTSSADLYTVDLSETNDTCSFVVLLSGKEYDSHIAIKRNAVYFDEIEINSRAWRHVDGPNLFFSLPLREPIHFLHWRPIIDFFAGINVVSEGAKSERTYFLSQKYLRPPKNAVKVSDPQGMVGKVLNLVSDRVWAIKQKQPSSVRFKLSNEVMFEAVNYQIWIGPFTFHPPIINTKTDGEVKFFEINVPLIQATPTIYANGTGCEHLPIIRPVMKNVSD